MGKVSNNLRRSAAVLAVAIGALAVSGSGASAAAVGLPAILNGKADSQALEVRLTLPSTDSLNAALGKLGLPANVLPSGLLGQQFVQVISLNSAKVLRDIDSVTVDQASGFAAPLQGLLGGTDKVSSFCSKASSCTSKSSSGTTIKVLDAVVPGGIGTIKVAAASSISKSLTDTRNNSGLAHVDLRLAPLFTIEALKPVADALRTLTDTVNNTVLPAVNPVLESVGDTVEGLLEGTPLDDAVTLGPIRDLPDLTKVDLLNLDVLPAYANVFPKSSKGVQGMLAQSHAKIANLDILGTGKNAWAHVGAIGLTTSSYANGKAGAAKAASDVEILGADLGGALGLSVPVDTLRDLTNGNALKAIIEKNLPAGDPRDELVAAVDLLYKVAGISVRTFAEETNIDPKGNFANATAGTIQIVVEPKIPLVQNALPGTENLVPRLGKDDFVSTGLKVEITAPNASSAVALGSVKGICIGTCSAKSGVATPLLAAIALIGAALMVRRFALAN